MEFELNEINGEQLWVFNQYIIREYVWKLVGKVLKPEHHYEVFFENKHLSDKHLHYSSIKEAMRACEKHFKKTIDKN